MGTTIDNVRVSTGHLRHRTSATGHADIAVRRCLAAADVAPSDVDLLINAGLYRDRNLGEPALAALIQDDVHMNADDPHPGSHGTFSFDVANGVCGPLSALQVTDGFLRAGAIRRAVVVASDANPGHRLAPAFPFAPGGAAALCGWEPGRTGLGPFRWLSRPEDGDTFRATVDFAGGRNLLHVDIDERFAEHAAIAAAKVADEVTSDAGFTPSLLDLVVIAPGDPIFVDAFCAASGIRPEHVVAPGPTVHTAGLLVAFHEAEASGRIPAGATVLLVAAGAGITAGAVLYTVGSG